VSGNFGTGAISNINVVGNDIKAFGEPPPFSYQITNNSFKDVKATDSALFVKGLINGTVSGNTFQVTNSIKLDNCTACTFSKNQVNSQANQAVIIRTTNGVTLSDNTLSTKDSPNQTAIVTASTPNNVLLKDNVLIKGAGGTYLSGNYTDQNNSKYDNIDPPAPAPARKIQITFQTVDGKPVTFQSGQTLTVYI
jgi:parallel beta-helix repeat protein